jgi:hypothetical protein
LLSKIGIMLTWTSGDFFSNGNDAMNQILLDVFLKYYSNIYRNSFHFPNWKLADSYRGNDLPLISLLYASDRKLSHVTSADKIFEKQFPADSEKFWVRNRSSRLTCKLNVIVFPLLPNNNNKNNKISMLFCFLFSELTNRETYNDLRSALWAERLDLDSIVDSKNQPVTLYLLL